jgi:hypothetical protein
MMEGIGISEFSRSIDWILSSNQQGNQKVSDLLDIYFIRPDSEQEQIVAALIHRLVMENSRRKLLVSRSPR